MPSDRLRLCRLDPVYMRELSKVDHNVLSTLPEQGKANRPFVGVVIVRGNKQYCVPLSSPKPKHKHMKADRDFSGKRVLLAEDMAINRQIAAKLLTQPAEPQSLRREKRRQPFEYHDVLFYVAYNAALAERVFARFKLRLYERH